MVGVFTDGLVMKEGLALCDCRGQSRAQWVEATGSQFQVTVSQLGQATDFL